MTSKNISKWSAAVMLTRVCIGPGLLCLPYITARAGVLFTPLILILIAFWNGSSCGMMKRCRDHLCIDCDPSLIYSRLSSAALGSFGNYITDFCVFVTLTGVTVAFQINSAILFVGASHTDGNSSLTNSLIAFGGLIAWLLSLIKNPTFLASVSLIGLQCIAFSIVAIFASKIVYPMSPSLTSLSDLGHDVTTLGRRASDMLPSSITIALESFTEVTASASTLPPPSASMIRLWPHTISDAAADIGVCTFSYGLCYLAFPIEAIMEKKEEFMEAVWIAMAFTTAFYILVVEGAIFLYENERSGIQENILLNLPPQSLVSLLARYTMATSCLLFCPLMLEPSASMIEPGLVRWGQFLSRFLGFSASLPCCDGEHAENSYENQPILRIADDALPCSIYDTPPKPTEEISLRFHTLTKFVLVSIITCLAISVPFFSSVVSLLGCFSISFLCLILPPLQQFILLTLPSLRRDGQGASLVVNIATSIVCQCIFELFIILLGSVICSVGTTTAFFNMLAKFKN